MGDARPKPTDGWQVFTLNSIDLQSAPKRMRPSARVLTQAPVFHARQAAWWQVGAAAGAYGATLTVQVRYEMIQGQLFRLPLALPPGWDVDRVELTPASFLRSWAVLQGPRGLPGAAGDRATLAVDLQRPLIPSAANRGVDTSRGTHGAPVPPPVQLTVWLHPSQRWSIPPTGAALTVPDLVPLGAHIREGTLGISVDPSLQVKAQPLGALALAPEAVKENTAGDGPWGSHLPDFLYSYRGLPASGTLQVQPRDETAKRRNGDAATSLISSVAAVTHGAPRLSVAASPVPLTCAILLGARNPLATAVLLASGACQLPGFSDPVIDCACLTSSVTLEGRVLHHYQFQVRNWRQRSLSLGLPAGSRCLAAKIDGRWIAQPEMPLGAVGDAEDAVAIALPVPAGTGSHHFEVLYEQGAPSWKIWTAVSAPQPKLPVSALALRRSWRLPPGVLPLHTEKFHRLPGPAWAGRALLPGWQGGISDFPSALASPAVLDRSGDWDKRQRQLMADAVTALRNPRHELKKWALGESLEYLVLEHLQKGKYTLVLDVSALALERLDPATVCAAASNELWAPWESLGLVVLPCRPAPVLTTRRQLETWHLSDEPSASISQSFEDAVAEAVKHGRDRSGRFYTVAEWLRPQASRCPSSAQEHALPAEAVDFGMTWTEWEPLAPSGEDEKLVVVRQDMIAGIGLVLSALLVWTTWRVRRRRRWLRLGSLLAWLAFAGLALLWLPESLRHLAWYPALAGLLLTLVGYLRSAARTGRRALALTATAVLLAVVHVPGSLGQAVPSPVTVYVVPGPKNAPEEELVLAPPELLKQLQDLSHSGAGPSNAVLVSARYEGQVVGGNAEFEAKFRVHCLTDESALLTLPLWGLQLKEALWDGAEAHLQPLRPPREGYTLELKAEKGRSLRGSHDLIVRFRDDIAATAGDDRSFRFSIPELVQSRLTLDTPAGSRFLFSAGRGLQVVTPEVGANAAADKPLHLEADLGRVGTLQVRWRQDGRLPRPATMQVREIYLWKLHASASSLFAVLQYTMKQGTTTSLTLDLPEPLEVHIVEAARLPGAGTDEPLPRLQEWRIAGTGNQRRLHLEFQRPVTTGVQVSLELVPRLPLGTSPVLPLPAPHETRTTEGFLAYQGEGLRTEVAGILRILAMDPKSFIKIWQAASMNDPGPHTQAYTFQREPGGPPFLKLNLMVPGSGAECVQQLSWHVGPRQADLSVSARLAVAHGASPTVPGRDLFLVEWEVPLTIRDIELAGPDIRAWSRTGSRVQVWLQRPLSNTEIKLTGWQPLEAPQATVKEPQVTKKTKGPALELSSAFRFRLASLGMVGARSQTTFVHITSGQGLAVSPEGLKNLWPLPESRPTNREHGYVTERADFGGVFAVAPWVTPGLAGSQVSVLTFAEFLGRDLILSAALDFQIKQGEMRSLTIRVRNWPGQEVRFEAPGVSAVAKKGSGVFSGDPSTNVGSVSLPPEKTPDLLADRTWTLTWPVGITGHYRLKLLGKMPAPATGVLMPDVSVEGAGADASKQKRWVAVAGRELETEVGQGLTPVTDAVGMLRLWPAEAERIRRAGSAWKIDADDWRLRLLPRSTGLQTASVRLLLTEQSAAVVDGRRWLHEATCWLYHGPGAELRLSLPSGAAGAPWATARLVALSLDGNAVLPIQLEPQVAPNRLWLPLGNSAGPRTVRLSWRFDQDAEKFDSPNLARPIIESATDAPWVTPAVWTVFIPAGYRADSKAPGATVEALSDSAAFQYFRRANAQLQLSTLLAEQRRGSAPGVTAAPVTSQLMHSQKLFYQACRQAEFELASASRREAEFERAAPAPPTALSEDRIKELKARNLSLALDFDFEKIRAEADQKGTVQPWSQQVPTESGTRFPDRGIPTRWLAATGSEAPRLHLRALRIEERRRQLEISAIFLLVLLGLGCLSFFPRLLSWVRFFWPEQMLLLGYLGWRTCGPGWTFVFLVLLGICGRLLTLAGWLRIVFRRSQRPEVRSRSLTSDL